MKKYSTMAVLASFLMASAASAQVPGGEPPAADVGGGSSAELTAEQMANDYLAKENLSKGKNGEDYICVGIAQLRCLPDSSDFDKCLDFGFAEALLNAKKSMSEFLVSDISTEMSAISSAGSEMFKEEAGGTSIANRAARSMIHANAAKLQGAVEEKMKKDGQDVGSPAGKQEVVNESYRQAAKTLIGTDELKKAAMVVSRAEVAGMYAKQCFVSTKGKGDVAVVCRLTAKSMAMVKAILGQGAAPQGTAKQSIASWARSVGDDRLAFMFGVQPRSDEAGNLCLVTFGMSFAKADASVMIKQAKARARLYAQSYLRNFAGELIHTSTLCNESLDTAVMSDNSSAVASDDAFKEAIHAKAEALKISGLIEAYTWELAHPLNGRKAYGVVMYWNLSNSKEANQLRQTLAAIGGSKGGDGSTNQLPDRPGSDRAAAPSSGGRKKAGEGVPSDHDDD
jgi:hypothetical protein